MGRVGVGLELEWGGLRRWRSSPTAFLMEWARKAKLELRGVEVGVVLELHSCVKWELVLELVKVELKLELREVGDHEHVLRCKLRQWGIREAAEDTLTRRAMFILKVAFGLVPTRLQLCFARGSMAGVQRDDFK